MGTSKTKPLSPCRAEWHGRDKCRRLRSGRLTARELLGHNLLETGGLYPPKTPSQCLCKGQASAHEALVLTKAFWVEAETLHVSQALG